VRNLFSFELSEKRGTYKGLPTILKDLKKQMDNFANLIKEKEKFKILTRD